MRDATLELCPHHRAPYNCATCSSFPPAVVLPVDTKPANPKDAIGVLKIPFSVVPWRVIGEIALGLLEGALKYGRHNYRVSGVRASVYYDATMRHMTDWWEGTDIDPVSGLHHVTKALSSLTVLRDAMLNEMCEDDRPPRLEPGWIDGLNRQAKALIEKYPEPKRAFTSADVPVK